MSTSQGRTMLVTGRIVWVEGDLFKGQQKTDMNTKLPLIDPRTNQPKMSYGFGLAVPKDQVAQVIKPNTESLWEALHKEALSLYPSGQLPPQFSMKYKDGDSVDHNGKPFAEREGYAGHLVFACTTSIPIKFFKYENGSNIQVNEGIKCGDYVTAQVQIKAHTAIGQGKPGIYFNPFAVQLAGYGKEIVRVPDASSIFGNAAPVVPQGASTTPVAPTNGFIVPNAQAPQQPVQQQVTPTPVQPNPSVIPTHLQQPVQSPVQGVPGMPTIPQMPR